TALTLLCTACTLFFYSCVARRAAPPFPTRRSSDLAVQVIRVHTQQFCGLGVTTLRAIERVDDQSFLGFIDRVVEVLRRRGSGLRSEEHTSELQSLTNLVCRLLLEKQHYRATLCGRL